MAVYAVDFDKMLDQLASNLEVTRPDRYQSEVDLKRYINLGMIEMAKHTKIVQATRFLDLSANVARYSMVSANVLRAQVDQVLYLKSGSLSGSQYPLTKLGRRTFQSTTSPANSTIFSAVIFNQPSTGYPTKYLLDGGVIEFRPIPTSATAGSNRICFKGPGIPDAMVATSAVPGTPLEHRMVPVTYATHLGQLKDKDPRAPGTLAQFLAECAEIDADTKWGDAEDPPSMLIEDYFIGGYWGLV